MTRIRYALLDDGGFVAECLNTGATAYAYPTSPYASKARKQPEVVARLMIEHEDSGTRTSQMVVDYDRLNHARLEAAGDAVKVIDEETV